MTPPPAKAADPSRDEAALAPAAVPSLGVGARARLLRALSLLPALAYLLIILSPPLNHDVAAILNFAERWVAGEQLYRDLIDVNPPLIFMLTAIPAAIAAWTPLDGPEALQLCTLLFCLGVWRLTVTLRKGGEEGPIEAAAMTALVPLTLLVAAYDFGQREHLMAMVAIPYAMLAARRAEGMYTPRGLMVVTTLIAALGFALKPHFLAVPGLIECFVLLRRGPRRALTDAAPWLMLAVWIVYLASIPVLFPDFFGRVVPLVLGYYVDGGFSTLGVMVAPALGEAGLPLLAAMVMGLRFRHGALASSLTLAGLGAYVSAVVQHKGWSYHALPILALSCLTIGIVVSRWLDGVIAPSRRPGAAPLCAAVMAAVMGVFMARGEAPWRQIDFHGGEGGAITNMLRQEAYGERLLVLGFRFYPIYPALNYARAQSTLRMMSLWLLEANYRECLPNGRRYRETWEMSREEFYVFRTVAEDFAAAPPAAVLLGVNTIEPCGGQAFDLVEYFSRHPLFAEIWKQYQFKTEAYGMRLYVRED